ncbi:MAG TPA: TrmH family RNA methyltransferase [Treponema sp.]|nr:TrmH family RNA methyltransferase [Treponema sp.]
MIPLFKLDRLPPGQRRRKLVRLLTGWERRLYALIVSLGTSLNISDINSLPKTSAAEILTGSDVSYLLGISLLVLEDPAIHAPAITPADRSLLDRMSKFKGTAQATEDVSLQELLRLCNHVRHALVHATGILPADWDFVHPETGVPDERKFREGVTVYAEDIRSPFNVGSVFRTAEAFGAERVLLSPGCASPEHPRAERSAMGCVGYIPWQRCELEELSREIPVFALETGGIPIHEFEFPHKGVVVIGSEELGISSEGLERATYGRVSIPMTGIKASINVGVAFGIVMHAWADYLDCSFSKAR